MIWEWRIDLASLNLRWVSREVRRERRGGRGRGKIGNLDDLEMKERNWSRAEGC